MGSDMNELGSDSLELASQPVGSIDEPDRVAAHVSASPAGTPRTALLQGAGVDGEAVIELGIVELRGLLHAAEQKLASYETRIANFEAANRALKARVETMRRNGSELIRETKERADAELQALTSELYDANEQIRELSEAPVTKQLLTLTVMHKKALAASEQFRERYDLLIQREGTLREDNQRLLGELADLRKRYDVFTSVMNAHVDALTNALERKTRALSGEPSSGARQRNRIIGQVLPSLLLAPIGLTLCTPALQYLFDGSASLSHGAIISMWGGLVLVVVSVVWAYVSTGSEEDVDES
jgi:hypothetical protein